MVLIYLFKGHFTNCVRCLFQFIRFYFSSLVFSSLTFSIQFKGSTMPLYCITRDIISKLNPQKLSNPLYAHNNASTLDLLNWLFGSSRRAVAALKCCTYACCCSVHRLQQLENLRICILGKCLRARNLISRRKNFRCFQIIVQSNKFLVVTHKGLNYLNKK